MRVSLQLMLLHLQTSRLFGVGKIAHLEAAC